MVGRLSCQDDAAILLPPSHHASLYGCLSVFCLLMACALSIDGSGICFISHVGIEAEIHAKGCEGWDAAWPEGASDEKNGEKSGRKSATCQKNAYLCT